MDEYGVMPENEAALARMLALAQAGSGSLQVPHNIISENARGRLTFRRIGNRTIAFVGKKAVGVAAGAGVAVEVVLVANWAIGWLATPEQTERMAARAQVLREILLEKSE
jgi:hypothetical protein